MSDFDEIESQVRADIERRGFHLGLVPGVDDTPAWAFSIGLLERHAHPELLCFGADGAFLMGLVESLAQRVVAGASFAEEERHSGVLQDYPVVLRPVAHKWVAIFLGNVAWYYRDEKLAVLQCFWPDRAARFPWEAGFAAEWREEQPQLFHHETQRALPEAMIEVLRKEQAL